MGARALKPKQNKRGRARVGVRVRARVRVGVGVREWVAASTQALAQAVPCQASHAIQKS